MLLPYSPTKSEVKSEIIVFSQLPFKQDLIVGYAVTPLFFLRI